jgi:hypothetical protein
VLSADEGHFFHSLILSLILLPLGLSASPYVRHRSEAVCKDDRTIRSLCIVLESPSLQTRPPYHVNSASNIRVPIPVAVRSKAWVCVCSLTGIVVSNPAWGIMSVSCECCVLSGIGLCDELVPRPEESYRLWCV